MRLTTAQATIKFLSQQFVERDQKQYKFINGVWGIFGHGNVAGLGEALYSVQDQLPTYRGHNEQSMAHAAIAFAKARQRQHPQLLHLDAKTTHDAETQPALRSTYLHQYFRFQGLDQESQLLPTQGQNGPPNWATIHSRRSIVHHHRLRLEHHQP